MPQKTDDRDTVYLKELTLSNAMQVDTLARLLIEKGIFTEQEFFAKLKRIQSEYKARKGRS